MSNLINKVKISRNYFSGMNSFDNNTVIDDTKCADIQNGLLTEAGLIVKRNGLTELGTTVTGATSCLGLGRLETAGTLEIFRVERTNLYHLLGSTWTNLKSNLTTGLETVFEQANSLTFLSNGTDNVFSINTSLTITDEGNTNADPPLATILEFHDNRMFAGGVSGNEDLVYFSDVADPQSWDRAVNNFKAWKGAKGDVTSLKSFKEKQLVIYKEDAILILDTSGANPLNDWQLTVFNPIIGCPAGRTVANVGNDHIFLAKDGVRILSRSEFDTVQAGVISREIQDIIDTINWNAITTSRAVFFDNKYILSIPTGISTVPNEVVIYDTLATLEAGRRGIPGNSWVRVPDGTWDLNNFVVSRFNTEPELIGGTTADGKIHKVLQGTDDDGTTIALNVNFKNEGINGVDQDMYISHIFARALGGEAGALQFFYNINSSSAEATRPSSLDTAGSTPVLPIDLPFDLNDATTVDDELYIKSRGKTCQISMIHNDNTTATFLGYEMYVRPIGQTEN